MSQYLEFKSVPVDAYFSDPHGRCKLRRVSEWLPCDHIDVEYSDNYNCVNVENGHRMTCMGGFQIGLVSMTNPWDNLE